MSIWRTTKTAAEPVDQVAQSDTPKDEGIPEQSVPGERGTGSERAFPTLQSRVSRTLTVTLMILVSCGLLVWYYTHAIGLGAKARNAALAAQQRRVQGDSTLPPLPVMRITPAHASGFNSGGGNSSNPDSTNSIGSTTFRSAEDDGAQGAGSVTSDSILKRVLGDSPQIPNDLLLDRGAAAPGGSFSPAAEPTPGSSIPSGTGSAPGKSPEQLALERELAGPVLTRGGSDASGSQPTAEGLGGKAFGVPESPGSSGGEVAPGAGRGEADSRVAAPTLNELLRATVTPAVDARMLPTQRFLLPKGAFVDCTLETAISSSLPGMTTCITATDTFSADGSVVLLERGTKLVGETRGGVQSGSPRLFVLWDEARTPTGVVVPLASPGTDELGRSGLSGEIDWHWWQRFGSAILVTVIDGVVQAIANKSDSTSVQVNPSGAGQVTTEVLRGTLATAPTINKPQGDRIEVTVARDIDFRTVYQIH